VSELFEHLSECGLLLLIKDGSVEEEVVLHCCHAALSPLINGEQCFATFIYLADRYGDFLLGVQKGHYHLIDEFNVALVRGLDDVFFQKVRELFQFGLTSQD